jgi:hypothetical protein
MIFVTQVGELVDYQVAKHLYRCSHGFPVEIEVLLSGA